MARHMAVTKQIYFNKAVFPVGEIRTEAVHGFWESNRINGEYTFKMLHAYVLEEWSDNVSELKFCM